MPSSEAFVPLPLHCGVLAQSLLQPQSSHAPASTHRGTPFRPVCFPPPFAGVHSTLPRVEPALDGGVVEDTRGADVHLRKLRSWVVGDPGHGVVGVAGDDGSTAPLQ